MKQKRESAKLVIGLGEQSADIRYATGFYAPDPVVLLQDAGERCLVVSALEYGRAVREAQGTEVLTPEALGLRARHRGQISRWAMALLARRAVRSVKVAGTFPLGVAEKLRRAGVRVEVQRGALFPEREVKTAAEVARIREVQQAAVIAMRAAVRKIARSAADSAGELRDGSQRLTCESIRMLIEAVLLERDCAGRDTIVACGAQSADPHERGSGPLRRGEPIVIDIFPQHRKHGYWGDLTRTVLKGRPSRELLRMYRAVRAAHKAALDRIGPRIRAKSVHEAAQRAMESRGFRTEVMHGMPRGFIHSTGHGVGLSIHELPSLGANHARLRRGNVVTVEPGLYYPGIGGVRIEDTVVVTADGWRYLYPCEKVFEV